MKSASFECLVESRACSVKLSQATFEPDKFAMSSAIPMHGHITDILESFSKVSVCKPFCPIRRATLHPHGRVHPKLPGGANNANGIQVL